MCPKCRDEKFIAITDADGVERYIQCECYLRQIKQEQIDRLFQSARIPRRFANKTFDNFDRKRQPNAFAMCKKYAAEFARLREEGKSLFLVGPVGTGKSHLAFAILNELIRTGIPGMAATVPDLMDELRPKNSEGGENDEKVRALKTIDFLVLDDLGAQKNSDWVTERLFVILNSRYAGMLPTVITSNNYLEELERILGWRRIVDRLIEMCDMIEFHGASYRQERRRGDNGKLPAGNSSSGYSSSRSRR